MSITETVEPVYTKTNQRLSRERNGVEKRPSDARPALLRNFLAFFLAAAAGFALAGFDNVKKQLSDSLHRQVEAFHWLVLVQGAQIDIDEVGRSLEKFPGLKEATFVSPESAFENLKQDAFLADGLAGLDASALPAAWKVRWTADFSVDKQDAFVAETRALPGVVDVAVDEKALSTIQLLREHRLGVSVVMTGFVFLLVLAGIAAGLYLFFSEKRWTFNGRAFLIETLVIAGGWCAGLALLSTLTGHAAWPFLLLGFAAGATSWAWRQTA